MRYWVVLFVLALPMTASAQLPMAGQVDIAASTIGLIPTPGGSPLPAAGTASIGASCSSKPITHDSAIWSVVIWGTAVPMGGALVSPGTSAYTLPTNPGHVFVPVVDTATISPLRIQVRDKVYDAAVTTNFGLLVLTFGPMTLSDMGDFLNALERSKEVEMALSSAQISAQLYDFTDPYMPPLAPADFYADELLTRLGPRPSATDFATVFRAASPARPGAGKLGLAAPTVTATKITFTGLNASTIPAAKQNVRTMIDAPPAGSPIFVIDEPCLQFSFSPVVGGEGDTSTAASFRARYDFYGGMGTSFLKLRVDGDGAPSGSYYQRIEGTIDIGINRKAPHSVLSFSGSGSYSTKRESGEKIDAWRGVAKLQVQGPNLAGIIGSLPGATTSPLFTVEFGGAGGSGLTGDENALIGRGTFAFTGRLTTRIYVDFRAAGAISGSNQFAGKDTYSYGSAQVRLNINKDWDYLIKYECGEKDPDYQHFCGGQSGLALTLGR